jgi:hypothetical protein
MSLFHSGMNHWQRQWLSDRLHKKERPAETRVRRETPAPPTPAPQIKTESSKPPETRRKAPTPKRQKIAWPAAETLEKLLWEKPTSEIAKRLGVSDKAIEKHAKKLGLKKPPRGYWAKIQTERK